MPHTNTATVNKIHIIFRMFLGFCGETARQALHCKSQDGVPAHCPKKAGTLMSSLRRGKDTRQPAIHVIADIGLLSVYGLLSVQKQILVHFHLLFQSRIGAYRLAGLFLSLHVFTSDTFFSFSVTGRISRRHLLQIYQGNGFTGHHVLQGILIHLEYLSFSLP